MSFEPTSVTAFSVRHLECTRLVMAASDKTITEILGSPDDMKFRSSMTSFDAVSQQTIFAEAIAIFYPDGIDRKTLSRLVSSAPSSEHCTGSRFGG